MVRKNEQPESLARFDQAARKGKTMRMLEFSDHFFLVTSEILVATASVTKLAFNVATLSVTYQKLAD